MPFVISVRDDIHKGHNHLTTSEIQIAIFDLMQE